jgi:arginase
MSRRIALPQTWRRCMAGGAGLGNVHDRMIPYSMRHTDLFRHTASPRTVSILGVPMTYGQPFVGTDESPALLRERGLRRMLTSLDWRVDDCGDMDMDSIAAVAAEIQVNFQCDTDINNNDNSLRISRPKARNCHIVGEVNKKLADQVEATLRAGRFPLVLGGDHSIGIGSLAGILRARPNTGILWIDAHADINTPDVSESGNLHGMPVGMLMEGIAPDLSKLPGMTWLIDGPRLHPNSIVYVGLRDVDPAERDFIRNLGIMAFTMHDIDHYGIGNVMDMALSHLLQEDGNRPLHVSYDIDAIDPVLAPATGTTVRGGLTFREAHFVAEAVARSGNLASVDLVELNPTLSDGKGADDTVELGLQIITSLMGKSIL